MRESVLIVETDPSAVGYKGQRIRDYFERVLDRSRWNSGISVEGYTRRPDEKPWIDMNAVSSDYFATMGIPLLAGRVFRAEDNPATTPDENPRPGPGEDEPPFPPPPPVAIVNEAFAKKFFPNSVALGRHFTQSDKGFNMAKSFEIVGVVKDSRYFDIRKPVEPMIYVPMSRLGANFETICIRSSGRPDLLASAVRREMSNVDAAIPVLQTRTLEDQFNGNIAQERAVTTLCGFSPGDTAKSASAWP